jgi:hypothetical protein
MLTRPPNNTLDPAIGATDRAGRKPRQRRNESQGD